MRVLPLVAPSVAVLLAGCGMDVVGTWQIESLSVDGVAVADAGFVDIRSNGDVSSGVPNAWMTRYWWDPDAGAWTPDPTPFVQTASFDVFAFQDDPGATALKLDFPVGPVAVEPAEFLPDNPKAGRWELTDPDWPHGTLRFELVR
ncbi:MAG: hypothetical protein H6742_15005 [Alphaproteobacteria bacterium]|nr:hypothetical protein [Alphaproteobacteria bacterium]